LYFDSLLIRLLAGWLCGYVVTWLYAYTEASYFDRCRLFGYQYLTEAYGHDSCIHNRHTSRIELVAVDEGIWMSTIVKTI